MNDDSSPSRLLCVDDNAELLQTLALSLRSHGFEVVTALNGIDALMQFRAHDGNFVAVITDNDMPKMNGSGLVKELHALDYHGRIVVVSGHWTVSGYQAYVDLPVTGFLQKPFAVGMLATLLKQTD